jgi:hypothetical protein
MAYAQRLYAVLAIGLAGCASATLIPDDQRLQVARELEGGAYYLRASVHVLPFFSDPTRRLVTPLPPDSVELLEDPSGNPILPGPSEALIPIGTRVRIDKVEFPTSLVIARRPLYSPRTNPWVYLSVVGEPSGRPYLAVLRPGIRTREEFLAVFRQLFVDEDPEGWLTRYPNDVRAALRQKRLLRGMDTDAARLAWGPPEKIHREFLEGAKVETWTWPLHKRTATFREGRLIEARPALE